MKTLYRNSIPRGLSYPVGLNALASALSGVPQYDLIQLSFSFYNRAGPEFGLSDPYLTLEVCYEHGAMGISASHYFEESGYYSPGWKIKVNPVPSDLSAHCKELLINEAFLRAKSWLIEHSSLTSETHKSLAFFYSRSDANLLVKEN